MPPQAGQAPAGGWKVDMRGETAGIEIAHSAEGNRGVVIMLVEAANADLFRGGLMARGYRPSVQRLG